jgi:hypothetical protein
MGGMGGIGGMGIPANGGKKLHCFLSSSLIVTLLGVLSLVPIFDYINDIKERVPKPQKKLHDIEFVGIIACFRCLERCTKKAVGLLRLEPSVPGFLIP